MAADPKNEFGEARACNGHPPWHPPQMKSSEIPQLKVYNSLTDSKEPFIPMNGKKVTWYTCGPTVYDVCHMGHARAYLTFDILRRILEDYFRYDVRFVVNVTDIDDKIIKRARCNKLVADYIAANTDFAKVVADVTAAVEAAQGKLRSKLEKLKEPLPENTPTRAVEERETLLKEQTLKTEQMETVAANVEAAKASGNLQQLLDAGKEPLSEHLDAQLGHTVTDHSVFDAHARKFERSYLEDMDNLGVRRPDVMTRVSEYIPQVVTFIKTIIEKGFAYESNGSVYFHTSAFKAAGHHYPKLKVGLPGEEATEAEMAEGEGALTNSFSDDKRSGQDFALWKSSKAGEPAWESPWGMGRPGWHIECSVMASDVFGNNMDIHAGGSDLRFPHHDNELAQSEACHGCSQWVNYFFHAGHLNIRGLKMSKSLKNFITIRQALAEHSPRQLRIMFLLQPWDKPMYYSDQSVGDAKAKEALFKNFFGAVKAALRADKTGSDDACDYLPEDNHFCQAIETAKTKVHAALCDNFDTPTAILALAELMSEVNKYLGAAAPRHLLLRKAAIYVSQILKMLGLDQSQDDIGFAAAGEGAGDKEAVLAPALDALVAFRDRIRAAAREQKLTPLLELCDALRDEALVDLGVRVEDRTDAPSLWKLDDPAALRREVEEKKAAAAEAAKKKRANQIEKLKKDKAKWEAAAVLPEELFKTGAHAGKFSEFDDKALPVKDKDGAEVSKSQYKANEKALNKHSATHKQFLEGGGAAMLQELTDKIAALELEA